MWSFIVVVLCATAAVHCYKPIHASQASVVDPESTVGNENTPIEILKQESDVNPDGSHFNIWESANGIKVHEEGTVKVVDKDHFAHSVNGQFSYNDEDGKPIVLTYVADENGYQPQGDHLPTPPPTPEAIARALKYVEEHPYLEEKETKDNKFGGH